MGTLHSGYFGTHLCSIKSNNLLFFILNDSNLSVLKGAQETCMEIAIEMQNALDWKTCPISMFCEIFSPYKYVLAALFKK